MLGAFPLDKNINERCDWTVSVTTEQAGKTRPQDQSLGHILIFLVLVLVLLATLLTPAPAGE